jgi:hypothetical protein
MPELDYASQGTFDFQAGLKGHDARTCKKFTRIGFSLKNKLTYMAIIDIIVNAREVPDPTEAILVADGMKGEKNRRHVRTESFF